MDGNYDSMRLMFETWPVYTRVVWKVRGLTLLLQLRTLWRCSDGLFFEVPPLASNALLITLHALLENVPWSSLSMVGKAQKLHGLRSGLYIGCSNGVPPISLSASIATLAVCGLALSWRLLRHPKKGSFKMTVTQTLMTVRGMKIMPLLHYCHHNLA